MLEDLYVYGKRPVKSTLFVSDQELRDRDAQYIVKEALQGKLNSATAFNINFAPKSSVMTASGRHKVEIIATAMTFINQNLSFTIHVVDKNANDSQRRLNQDRARAIASHMRVKHPIKNRLIIAEKSASSFIQSYLTNTNDTQNVIFENLGETLSQLGTSK